MAHPQGVDAVWNDCAGRSGMEKYRDNDPGKEQTAYDRLSDEALLRQLRAGDAAIMDYVLDKYKPLVRKKANAMFLIGGDTDDLIQEGMIGLFKAIRDYREERNFVFPFCRTVHHKTDLQCHRGIQPEKTCTVKLLCFFLFGGE